VNQGSTLSDIQYQMVLRNLANFAVDPSAIPWHLAITAGTTQIADAGTAHLGLLAHDTLKRVDSFFETNPTATASRTIVQQWSTNPIVHTEALRILQVAYRRACGIDEMPDAKLVDDMAHEIKKQVLATEDLKSETALFYQSQYAKLQKSYETLRRGTTSTVGEQVVVPAIGEPEMDIDRKSPLAREVAREVNDVLEDLRAIPSGWFGVGRKRDVPHGACRVAHEGKVYVWVLPEHREELSKFAMLILDIGNAVQEPQTLSLQGGGLSFSPGFTAPAP
jgi:hypothetical protein